MKQWIGWLKCRHRWERQAYVIKNRGKVAECEVHPQESLQTFVIKPWINWKKGDIQIRTHGGAWYLMGCCLHVLLRVSIFCLSLQLGRFWQPALLPRGFLGLCGNGDSEGSCEAGSPSALRVQTTGPFDFGRGRERTMLLWLQTHSLYCDLGKKEAVHSF